MQVADPAPEARPIITRPTSGTGGAMDKTGFAWAVFEWARNPYYILVVIYIFAPYFARDIIGADLLASGELDGVAPDEALATANAQGQATIASVTKWAGLIAALTAPFLGAALDRGGRLKPLLAVFLGTITLCSALLWFAQPGGVGLPVWAIMSLLVIAYVSYTYSEVTHNAMLSVSGEPKNLSMISGLGLGLGNLASMLILSLLHCCLSCPGQSAGPLPSRNSGSILPVSIMPASPDRSARCGWLSSRSRSSSMAKTPGLRVRVGRTLCLPASVR